jgi:hypothetical protein
MSMKARMVRSFSPPRWENSGPEDGRRQETHGEKASTLRVPVFTVSPAIVSRAGDPKAGEHREFEGLCNQGKIPSRIQQRRAVSWTGRFICRQATVARPTAVVPRIAPVAPSTAKCSFQVWERGSKRRISAPVSSSRPVT